MAEIFIDGNNAIMGRLASYAAKQALQGNNIYIFNAEKVVILGEKKFLLRKYWLLKKDIGEAKKGPHYPKMPHMIVKRAIRGMVPKKKARGKQALKKVIVHIGVPKEYKDKELKSIAQYSRERTKKFIRVADLARSLGWKG